MEYRRRGSPAPVEFMTAPAFWNINGAVHSELCLLAPTLTLAVTLGRCKY
jgi:hypothetical protein